MRRHLALAAYVSGFSAVFYFYVLLRIRPELFYHLNPLVFLLDFDFLAGFMDQPGGLVEYASAFLSPLFAYGWLGALVVTSLAVLICLATRQFVMAVAGVGGQVVFLIPAVLVLMVLGQYMHPVRLCVGLALVLAFVNGYVWLGGRHVALRLTVFVIASAAAYYVAAGLYVVFACLCGVFELGVRRRFRLGALCLACAVVIPIVEGAWLFDLSVREAYRGLMLPDEGHWLAAPSSLPIGMTIRAGLLLFFPIAAISLVLHRRFAGSSTVGPGIQDGPTPATDTAHVSNRPIAGVRLVLQAAALLILGFVADVASFDFPKKCLLEIGHSAEHRRWADVLTHARRLPLSDVHALDPRVASDVNRALYYRGDLLDEMFTYPQALDTPSLALAYESATAMAKLTPRQCSDVFFDLGRINESQHMAYEALEVFGERPRLLERVVYIHVLKGEPEAARRFLTFMERSLLYGRWARRLDQQLDADPTLSGVPEVASRRELMVVRDSVSDVANLEAMLLGLLERNPRNRMALEYLMAHYLLTRQLDKLVANLRRLDAFDDPRLPRHCEEALVIYLATTGSRDFDLGSRRISPETRRRFGEFVSTERRFRADVSAAFAALYPEFGDSYFFCYVFGQNNPAIEQSKPIE
ncbi:MAG: DUF6057 family protein [Planctomycetota bacterium]